jgi:hypothetical protein
LQCRREKPVFLPVFPAKNTGFSRQKTGDFPVVHIKMILFFCTRNFFKTLNQSIK